MSLYKLFKNAIPRLTRTEWGSSITDRDGESRDTGVNDLAEELAAILASQAPIALDAPLQVIKNYTGTTFEVVTEPDVEAANDPLSVDAFGGVKLTVEDVRDAANDAQDTANTALALAKQKTRFPGIIRQLGDGTTTAGRTTLYTVEIDTGNALTDIKAYPFRNGSAALTVNTLVMCYRVDGDDVVSRYMQNRNLAAFPAYYFLELHTTA